LSAQEALPDLGDASSHKEPFAVQQWMMIIKYYKTQVIIPQSRGLDDYFDPKYNMEIIIIIIII
jgi:hypothetical protein